MSRRVLIAMKGLPGCGKTTTAEAWVAADPTTRVRINRDSLRTMFHGGWFGAAWQEDLVTIGEVAVLTAMLAHTSVVLDDTNLDPDHMARWRALAAAAGCTFHVNDMTGVPLPVCIARDATRTGAARVGEDVIRRMHARWLDGPVGRRVADRDGFTRPRRRAARDTR